MTDDPDRELRLRNPPPSVVRLSRRAVALAAGAAAIAIAGVVGWSLTDHGRHTAAEAAPPITSAEGRPPEQLATLPKDYARLPPGVPKLGPPLPGDLGRPFLAGGAADPASPGPSPQPSNPAREAADNERRQARSSRLFAATSPMSRDGEAGAWPSSGLGRDGEGAAPFRAISTARQSQTLPAGTTIRAALLTGLRSDLPGAVVAQVTEDVLDSATGRTVLIPAGAKLIGEYDSKVAFGQDRAFLAWTRLVFPDGHGLELPKAPATDGQGYAGLQDQVERHWGQLFAASLVSLGVAAAADPGGRDDEAQLLRALRGGLSDTAQRIGEQMIGRSLAIQPSLSIRPGYPVRVLLTRDLIVPSWRGDP